MKLLVDVSEATSPASVAFVFRPFCEKFVAITEDKSVKEVWALLELVELEPDEAVGVAVSDGIVGEGVTVALTEVVPLVAPVAARRAFRSACDVQAILVPAELTNGNAAQLMIDGSLACREKHRQDLHQTGTTGRQDILSVDTLGELTFDTSVARGAGRVSSQCRELIAV